MSGPMTWHQELADLPLIPVDAGQQPHTVVLNRDDEIIGWAFVFPDGSAWLVRPDAKSVIHSGTLKTLVNFWGSIFECEVGVPVDH